MATLDQVKILDEHCISDMSMEHRRDIKDMRDEIHRIKVIFLTTIFLSSSFSICLGIYLGMTYEKRQRVTDNLVTAGRHYLEGARQGNPEAMYSLSVFYRDGLGGLDKDQRRARRWLKRAAKAGVPIASQILGKPTPQARIYSLFSS